MPASVVRHTQRRTEFALATLFLIAAAIAIRGVVRLDPVRNARADLFDVSPIENSIAPGSLMWSVDNVGILFVAWLAHPSPRGLDAVLAVGRVDNALSHAVGVASRPHVVDASPGGGATTMAPSVALFGVIVLPFRLFFKSIDMPEVNPIHPRSTT